MAQAGPIDPVLLLRKFQLKKRLQRQTVDDILALYRDDLAALKKKQRRQTQGQTSHQPAGGRAGATATPAFRRGSDLEEVFQQLNRDRRLQANLQESLQQSTTTLENIHHENRKLAEQLDRIRAEVGRLETQSETLTAVFAAERERAISGVQFLQNVVAQVRCENIIFDPPVVSSRLSTHDQCLRAAPVGGDDDAFDQDAVDECEFSTSASRRWLGVPEDQGQAEAARERLPVGDADWVRVVRRMDRVLAGALIRREQEKGAGAAVRDVWRLWHEVRQQPPGRSEALAIESKTFMSGGGGAPLAMGGGDVAAPEAAALTAVQAAKVDFLRTELRSLNL
eukprot:g15353.t1